VEAVLAQHYRTADIVQEGCTRVGTSQMGDLICDALRKTMSAS
jgi:3-isopropylmalate dehydrogenase